MKVFFTSTTHPCKLFKKKSFKEIAIFYLAFEENCFLKFVMCYGKYGKYDGEKNWRTIKKIFPCRAHIFWQRYSFEIYNSYVDIGSMKLKKVRSFFDWMIYCVYCVLCLFFWFYSTLLVAALEKEQKTLFINSSSISFRLLIRSSDLTIADH